MLHLSSNAGRVQSCSLSNAPRSWGGAADTTEATVRTASAMEQATDNSAGSSAWLRPSVGEQHPGPVGSAQGQRIPRTKSSSGDREEKQQGHRETGRVSEKGRAEENPGRWLSSIPSRDSRRSQGSGQPAHQPTRSMLFPGTRTHHEAGSALGSFPERK